MTAIYKNKNTAINHVKKEDIIKILADPVTGLKSVYIMTEVSRQKKILQNEMNKAIIEIWAYDEKTDTYVLSWRAQDESN